ncbi:MAG: hypothetical protein H0T73_09965 [Ardenticatenales bacterium]|nr:hypothetical protein [Ardenticatenales bacterium]
MANEVEKSLSSERKPSFWSTMPGILSGIAALLTAITGLLAAASAAGLLAAGTPTPAAEALVVNEIAAPAPTFASASPAESTFPSLEGTATPLPPTLLPSAPTIIPLFPDTPVTLLEVEFVTGDATDAGTQDKITFSITKSDWELSDLDGVQLEAGGTQRYQLPVGRSLTVEDIKEVKVCKEKGKEDGWYLKQVRLYVNGQVLKEWQVERALQDKADLCWREEK